MNKTFFITTVIEGQLNAADLINQAYIRSLFNDTVVVGGV